MKLDYGTSRLTECCRTRKKVIPTANQKQENITIHKGPMGIQSNNKQNCLKREKPQVTSTWMVLVLPLMGWQGGAIFLD